jgi:hypothetical protein
MITLGIVATVVAGVALAVGLLRLRDALESRAHLRRRIAMLKSS